jgi:rubrerythrin
MASTARSEDKQQTATTALTQHGRTTKTMTNLEAAYQAEYGDRARYLAFADKADAEGYKQVASMFRAIARAEEVHAANYAALLKGMGGATTLEMVTPGVASTRENVQWAIDQETKEKDTMYPAFITQARKDKNEDAARCFHYAMSAESEHFAVYQQAAHNLDDYKGGASIPFMICPLCGKTVRSLGATVCPVCSTPKDKFVEVR